jgi:hypothetical protein
MTHRLTALLCAVLLAASPAWADFGGWPQNWQDDLHMGTKTLYRATCASDVSDLTTYTFTGISTGAPANVPVVVIVGIITEDALATFNTGTVTVDGYPTTEIIDEAGSGIVNTSFNRTDSQISNADTVDVSVTMSEAVTGMVVCVWAVANSVRHDSVAAIQDDDTASGALILTLTPPRTDSVVVGICVNSGVADATTWAILTERQDTENAEFDYSSADATGVAASSQAVTCDWTGANDASGSAVSLG